MKLTDHLKTLPPIQRIENARALIREKLIDSGKRLVIIDDDPTGPQAVQDVPVYMDWSVETLEKAFHSGAPVFFICTNTRSLGRAEMKSVSLEAGRNLRQAAEREQAGFLLMSRSDSTLRGHYPEEIEALLSGTGFRPDGVILVPAFFEGRRFTIGDIHYAEQDGDLVPVHLTEFARDPAFPYRNSDLKKWVEEKTTGRFNADDVISISLKTIRKYGVSGVTDLLQTAADATPVFVNAVCYEDLEVLALAIAEAEERGKTFFYRCSASFIKARGGFDDRPLLTYRELKSGTGAGLIVAGSYVEKTSKQLSCLLEAGIAEGVELRTNHLQDSESADAEIRRIAGIINANLENDRTTALFTSRERVFGTGDDFQRTGQTIMNALCRIVSGITRQPAFVIAKGGVTSIELARTALGAREAFAIGQILPGVPVWRLAEPSRWAGIPYVVFPGNVGEEDALLQAVRELKTN